MSRYVVLVIDEMKIRADLVFDKTSGDIVGYVDYGEGTLTTSCQCYNRNASRKGYRTERWQLIC